MKKVTKKQYLRAANNYIKAREIIDKYDGRRPIIILKKDGVKYINCEHLEKGIYDNEITGVWAGDGLRFVFCSVCTNNLIGQVLRALDENFDKNIRKDEEANFIPEKIEEQKDVWKIFTKRWNEYWKK